MVKKIICITLYLLSIAPFTMADPFVGAFVADIGGDKFHLSIMMSDNGSYKGVLNTLGEETAFAGITIGDEFVGNGSERGVLFQFKLRSYQDNALLFYLEDKGWHEDKLSGLETAIDEQSEKEAEMMEEAQNEEEANAKTTEPLDEEQ